MDITIRKIEEQDYPAVTALFVNDLWNNYFSGDNVAPFFERIKNNDCYTTFVALLDGEAVGVITTVEMFWAISDIMFVQAFVVKTEYQSKGIGSQLLKHTEEYAKSKGISGVGLQSGDKRTAAHAFYESKGYERSNYFYKNF